MKELLVLHGEIISSDKEGRADLYIENRRLYFAQTSTVVHPISEQNEQKNYQTEQIIDADGCYITTGLFDLQVNGSPECNLWADPTATEFDCLCQRLLKAGTTAFLPTLITDEWQHLKKNISFLESMGINGQSNYQVQENGKNAVDLITMPGIHLEGPFLSPQRPGVHPKQYLQTLRLSLLEQLARPSVKLITFAPELENSQQSVRFLKEKAIVASLGHSNATFDEAELAFGWGINMVTHIFNALPPIQQRQPGAVLAGLLAKDVYCCVICDGLHVDPNMVKLLVEVKGVNRVILVTDMASTGTAAGGLVGSSITLSEAVRNIVKWGIVTFPEAIKMATFNPAKAMHLEDCLGDVKTGRRADLVVWDKKTLAIKHVIANGELVF